MQISIDYLSSMLTAPQKQGESDEINLNLKIETWNVIETNSGGVVRV